MRDQRKSFSGEEILRDYWEWRYPSGDYGYVRRLTFLESEHGRFNFGICRGDGQLLSAGWSIAEAWYNLPEDEYLNQADLVN